MGKHRKPKADRDQDQPARAADGTGGKADQADDIARNHQARVNQVRDEPMPASHDDDPRQEAVVRNEEYSHASEERE
jgi:hypothetical protein